jgi:hypothetical protein
MNAGISYITPAHALRLCVKAKQPDRSELSYLRIIIPSIDIPRDKMPLRCIVEGLVAMVPDMGYYLFGSLIIIPLHDESFLIAEHVPGDGHLVCSGFRLAVGHSSLRDLT